VRLIRFRVRDFRSVVDSDWIEVERVTALIGVNEPGKTNLLLPLWKLNPAREGEIRPTSDGIEGKGRRVRCCANGSRAYGCPSRKRRADEHDRAKNEAAD
jgi:predicted ATPase